MNRNYAKLNDSELRFAPDYLIVDGTLITNPHEQTYLANGWKRYVDARPEQRDGYYLVHDGYEQTDAEIRVKWKYVENPPVYRKFSKLKIYGAIASLGKWAEVQSWLESKNIDGINGWLAFQLAQEISEEHQLFKPLSQEAKTLLGLSDEQFNSLLNSCILEIGA